MNISLTKFIHSALLICVLLITFPAVAEEAEEEVLSAREFLASCEKPAGASRPTQACMQFIFGLVQTVVMMQQMEGSERLFCIDPNAISLEEVTDTVTTWLEKVPARHDEEAYVLVSEALNASYPCTASTTI